MRERDNHTLTGNGKVNYHRRPATRRSLDILTTFRFNAHKGGRRRCVSHDETTVREKARAARERGVTEVCTVSGLRSDFDARSYIDIISWIRDEAPAVHIHASNPIEVAYAAKKSSLSMREVLTRMQAAGLGTLCGTAAEILVDRVRAVICREKIDTATRVRIIREAHDLGIRSTATIMYGHCESEGDRAWHLGILPRSRTRPEGSPSSCRSRSSTKTPRSTGRGVPGPGRPGGKIS